MPAVLIFASPVHIHSRLFSFHLSILPNSRAAVPYNVDHRGYGGSPLHATTMNAPSLELPLSAFSSPEEEHTPRAHYSPPWANTSIIGVAGSSGSGKTSLSMAIIRELSLPWVVILSMDSFYKPVTPEQSAAAFRNEYDFDAPEALDFDTLVEKLREIKAG